jgi:hypothetical protein
MNTFDFIGFMESYAEDIRVLSRLLSIPIVEFRKNFNTSPNYQDNAGAIRADRRLMAVLEDYLAEDIRFYETLKMARFNKSMA